jgi:hypothetical protein
MNFLVENDEVAKGVNVICHVLKATVSSASKRYPMNLKRFEQA